MCDPEAGRRSGAWGPGREGPGRVLQPYEERSQALPR
jgi:hypothetical protein